jgi:hypothetical protein
MRFNTNRALCGLVCVVALGAMQAARADDTTKLVRTYKEGDKARYKQTIKVSVMGMDVVVTTTDKLTVKEVKKTGDVVEVREGEGGTMTLNGADQPSPPTPAITITFDKSDKLSDYKPSMEGGFFDPGVANLVAVAHHFLLTDKAVKKDDTWETELDNPAVKGKKMTVKDTFLGTEKRDGKDLWKIKQTGEPLVDAAGGKMTFEFTALLDPATGQLVHSEGNVKQIPTQFGSLDWTEEENLLKPEAEKKTADADTKKP